MEFHKHSMWPFRFVATDPGNSDYGNPSRRWLVKFWPFPSFGRPGYAPLSRDRSQISWFVYDEVEDLIDVIHITVWRGGSWEHTSLTFRPCDFRKMRWTIYNELWARANRLLYLRFNRPWDE